MIQRFHKVANGLYRGSAPSPEDVHQLKDKFGIKKIVSLDKLAGDRIDRTCKLLNIKHIILPINVFDLKKTLMHFLKYDIKKLLLDDGPTFIHCEAGKDRTGFAIALLQCKYLGKSPEDAIKEAKELGFGIHTFPKMISLFEKLIRSCKPVKDINNADIVSNEREYISDNRDSFLDEGHLGSFAPYSSITRQNPQDALYNFVMEQSPTRENYMSINEHNNEDKNEVPLVGIYNNDAGMFGAAPLYPAGGFISE